MSTPTVALVTCAELPELDADDRPLIALLRERGVEAQVAIWDDPAVDWASFDLAVLRSTWDYTSNYPQFLNWISGVPRLVNPPNVVRWNSDKHYLQALAAHGLGVIETSWLEPERGYDKRALHNRFPAREEFVIKPAVSAGSLDSARYTATDADSRRFAIEHAYRLLNEGRSVMVQRYLEEVDTVGEVALIFFHGSFSHAVRKEALLEKNSEAVSEGLHLQERIRPYQATAVEVETAQAALAFARARIPGRSAHSRPLTYARVDVVTPGDGVPLVMELELVEPSLFLGTDPAAAARFADAIVAELRMGPDPANIPLA